MVCTDLHDGKSDKMQHEYIVPDWLDPFFLDKVSHFLDKDNSADLIYLELSEAFGTVTRGELLVKPKRMRISTRMSIQ